MDVKILCLLIPSLDSGGMERVMVELAHYFCSKKSYNIHIVIYGPNKNIFYKLPSNLTIHYSKLNYKKYNRFIFTIRTSLFIRNLIKEINPTSILSFGETWNNFILLSTIGLNYPTFVSDRAQPDKSLGPFHDLLRKILYSNANGIICQTEYAKIIFSKLYKHHNFIVIGNPIRMINTQNNINKENIILSVGRLIETKHHDDLIKIFHKCNYSNWKLVIIGDDSLNQKNKVKLQNLINELGLQDNVCLAGKRSDVDLFYLKSKIFAFTSSSEGFPNVIGEAMSAGLPIVAFNYAGGISDLVFNGISGFLIDDRNEEKFIYYLNLLISDSDLRIKMGYEAKQKVISYNIDNIGKKYEDALFKF